MPGLPFDGDGDRYPHRDEVVDCLTRYADRLDSEIRTHTRIESMEHDSTGFTLRTADGRRLGAAGIVAASGAFGNPLLPATCPPCRVACCAVGGQTAPSFHSCATARTCTTG
ncbi:hypothetical protein [Streptomyces sp. TRM68367]|uniref:hypothetical protein n=1 Tax=Streptomyces sp. TRM68367 TaxID=2758415 RepID=UPI0021D03AD5|nr:hypothetical protein [Streptomyces sp. TRM68367]